MVLEGHLTGCFVAASAAAAQITVQAAAAPQTRYAVHNLQESAPESGVHIAIDDRVVATVRHGQPMEREPHVRQRSPSREFLVVEQQLDGLQ